MLLGLLAGAHRLFRLRHGQQRLLSAGIGYNATWEYSTMILSCSSEVLPQTKSRYVVMSRHLPQPPRLLPVTRGTTVIAVHGRDYDIA